MKAAVYHDTADIRIETVPDPALAPGELILEVHAAGICGTDVTEYRRGPIQYPIRARTPVTGHLGPLIPGHEVAGRIVAIGPGVQGFEIGQVVASGAGISCGEDLPEALRLLGSRSGRWTDVAPTLLPLERLVEDGILAMAERCSGCVKTLIDPYAGASRGRAS